MGTKDITDIILDAAIDIAYKRFQGDEAARKFILSVKDELVENLRDAANGHDMEQAIIDILCYTLVNGYVLGRMEADDGEE